MFHVQCKQCGAWTTTPDVSDVGALKMCGCCAEDHDHDETANACPSANIGHQGVTCPEPDPVNQCHVTPAGEDCPGGHCHVSLPDCTVCRPVTITLMPGSVAVPAVITGG